jgi:hypothetical protein
MPPVAAPVTHDELLGAWLTKSPCGTYSRHPADAAAVDKAIVSCLADDVSRSARWAAVLVDEILAHNGTGASNGPTEGLNLCEEGEALRPASASTTTGPRPRRRSHLATPPYPRTRAPTRARDRLGRPENGTRGWRREQRLPLGPVAVACGVAQARCRSGFRGAGASGHVDDLPAVVLMTRSSSPSALPIPL